MGMTRVPVKTAVLQWARERSGLSLAKLSSKFPKMPEWESGKASPTLKQVEGLAKVTLTPLGYFFLPEPPEERLPIPLYRSAGGSTAIRPSPNLLEIVQTLQRRQAWMREYLIDQGQERLPFVARLQRGPDHVRLAASIRGALGLDVGWAKRELTWTDALGALRGAAEKAGILVSISGIVGNNTSRKLDPSEFRGFVLIDEYAPMVFVNGADWKSAQMFTLAHELAHVWLGESAAFDLRDFQSSSEGVEKACNRVAAEFLVPEHELREHWPVLRRAGEPFQEAARHFKVSAIVVARRALDCELISRDAFFAFLRAYEDDERRKASKKSSGGDFYATLTVHLGRRFAEAVVRAAQEGKLQYRNAYELTDTYGATFDRYAKELGIGLGIRM